MKRPLRTKNRSCAGKRRHETRKAALEHLLRLRGLGGVRLNVYECDHCTWGTCPNPVPDHQPEGTHHA